MINVSQLQQLNPAAWTAVLGQGPDAREVIATAVEDEPVIAGRHLIRYRVALQDTSDPISFIGKHTNAAEARFYRQLGPQLAPLAPHCLFSFVEGRQGWVVLDEAHNDFPPESWTHKDVEAIVDDLANVHAEFWAQERYLTGLGWLPYLIGQRPAQLRLAERESLLVDTWQEGASRYFSSQKTTISEHAIRSSGQLAPVFIKASAGLDMLREWGGWPGVLGEKHLQAAAELLDDPVPMIETLREMPVTLLHGNPAVTHWRLSLLNERRLLDWGGVAMGPAVCDLVSFLEQFELDRDQGGGWHRRSRLPASEETIVDGYLLSMSQRLGRRFNARLARQAIPSARCLYVLTSWLPCFADWFQQLPSGPSAWQKINRMSERQLLQAGYGRLANLRPYLAGVFKRFLSACRSV